MIDSSFSVDLVHLNGQTVVRFLGELDLAQADHAEEHARRALARTATGPLIIDLSELSYCDSSGIRALLHIQAEAQRRGVNVLLRRPRPLVHRVFELAGVVDLLQIDGDPSTLPTR